MSEDWRLQRAAEIFGGPLPAGGGDVLPLNFDRRSDDNAGRRSADRRQVDAPPPGGPTAQLPVVSGPAPTAAAWPWRWRLLAAFLALQTALIVWLVVGRPTPVQRVVYVTPPAVAPAAPLSAPAPALDVPTPELTGPVADLPVVQPTEKKTEPAAVASPNATKLPVAAAQPKTRPAAKVKRAPAKPSAIRPAVPVPAAPSSTCIPGSGPAASVLCADPILRRFDEQMQLAYAQVIAHGDRQLIALAARDRLRFIRRRDKCGDAACLTRVYTDRIVALVKLLPAGAATPPICQPEQYTRVPLMNCWPSRLRDVRKPFYSK